MGVFTLFNYFFKVALQKSSLRFFSLLLLVLVGFSQAAVAQCDITSISTSMISACNDNGTTPDASDDFFTADVTILFQATPATGSLQIAGDNTAIQSIDVTTLPPGATSYTFPAVSFTADGTPISITASFIGDPSCTFSLPEPSAGLAPASCSPDCVISNIQTANASVCNNNGTPQDPSDDFFTTDIIVTFSNPPTTGTLNVTGDNIDPASEVTTAFGGTTSFTFTSIRMSADGGPIDLTANFTDSNCPLNVSNAGTAPVSCSPDCVISNIQTANASVCNNNGTPQDPSDDFFTTDIIVTFSNPPTTGTLNVTGDAVISEGVTALNGLPTSHTFTGVQMVADGSPIDLTASFSDSTCPLNVPAAGTAPASCSEDCSIDNIEFVVGSDSICNDNGTVGDASDDFFTYDVMVTFTNVPATGALVLSTPTETVNVAVGGVDSPTSHTFVGLQSPADGAPIDITAAFTDDAACTLTLFSVLTAQNQCSVAAGPGGLELNKTHCDWGYTTTDTYKIRYFGVLTNNGTDPVYNINLTDDLGTPFLGNAITIISASADGPIPLGVSQNANFNGTSIQELINVPTLSELGPGESINYGFCIEVAAGANLDQVTVTNQIIATANDAATGAAYEVTASDSQRFEENTIILSAGFEVSDPNPTINTDGTYDFSYTITLRNSGSNTATNIQYSDVFDHLVASGVPVNSFSLNSKTGVLMENAGFDGASGTLGGSTSDLLMSGQSMAPNTSAQWTFDLNVGPTTVTSVRESQGVFSGIDNSYATARAVSDVSRRNLDAAHDREQCNCDQTPVTFTSTPLPLITKTVLNNDPAGTLGNRDITFQIEIENGPLSPIDLSNLQITDNIGAMCPGNIVSVSAPVITTSTALTDPVLDPTFTGLGSNDIFQNNTGILRPGERVIVQYEVEITLPCTGDNTAIFNATDPGNNPVASVSSSVGINNPPEATDDNDTTQVDTPITIDVLNNDSDPDMDPIMITEVDGMAISDGGSPVLLSDGTIVQIVSGELVITPPPGSSAPVSFPYIVEDTLGNRDTANVFITIVPCTVAVISLDNISACNSNGTSGDPTDDTFTADVVVQFTNAPGSGNLDLTGAGINTFVPVTGLDSATQHRFTNLTFSADGGPVNLTATFDNPSGCTDTQNAGTAPDSCSVAQSDMSITKTLNQSGPFAPGDTVSWNIVVSNLGTDLATNVFVTDTPTNVTITNINGGGCTTFPCNLGSITANTPFSDVTIIVTGIIDGPGAFTNITAVSADQVDSVPANDTDDGSDGNNDGIAVGNANLVTVKTLMSGDSTPAEGDTVAFAITVTNNGPDDATNVSLVDAIPAGLTATINNGNTGGDQPSTYTDPNWTIPFIASGQFVTLNIEGVVDAGEDGNTITNSTTAATTPDQTDPTTAGDDLNESITVDGAIPDPCDALASGNSDSDGDGVSDICDVDDDNDGILDNEECEEPIGSITMGDGTTVLDGNYSNSTGTSAEITITSDHNTSEFTSGVTSGLQLVWDQGTDVIHNMSLSIEQPVLGTVGSIVVANNAPGSNYGAANATKEVNITWPGGGSAILNDPNDEISGYSSGDVITSGEVFVVNTGSLVRDSRWTLSIDLTGLNTYPVVIGYNSDASIATTGIVNEGFAFNLLLDCDFDQDGIPNRIDLDSDNDGCNDVLESEGTDNDDDGVLGDTATIVDSSGQVLTPGSGNTTGGYNGVDGNEFNATEVVVDSPPSDQTVENGSNATFTAVVRATSTMEYDGFAPSTTPDFNDPPAIDVSGTTTYQWYLGDPNSGGSLLAGETGSSLILTTNSSMDGNQYCVVITHPDNICFTQTECAILTVTTTDCSQVVDGTVDVCALLAANPSNPIGLQDCDGDGETNLDECNAGSDPTDPCSIPSGSSATADTTNPIWQAADCDGDGETNGDDPAPFDPCVGVELANVDLSDNNTDWYNADCDGDGVINGLELDPDMDGIAGPNGTDLNDPCDYNEDDVVDGTQAEPWLSADCDGDGVLNSAEIANGTDPTDACDYIDGAATVPATSMGDCDGDGVTDADEINGPDGDPTTPDGTDSNDACDYDVADISLPVTSIVDCDGDGVTDADEINGPDGDPATADGTDP
ncbi:MAG: Ig-like domain-containing protein, partial [Nonlabens ulvanivorans]|uniref:beta strand repeat-containing protein n=1 Tax=Nonlabens ulvanivorans TaxID=906888 RepID=UPI0032977A4E